MTFPLYSLLYLYEPNRATIISEVIACLMDSLSISKEWSPDVLIVRSFLSLFVCLFVSLSNELSFRKICCTLSSTQILCSEATVGQRCFYDKIECLLLLLRDHHTQRKIDLVFLTRKEESSNFRIRRQLKSHFTQHERL